MPVNSDEPPEKTVVAATRITERLSTWIDGLAIQSDTTRSVVIREMLLVVATECSEKITPRLVRQRDLKALAVHQTPILPRVSIPRNTTP